MAHVNAGSMSEGFCTPSATACFGIDRARRQELRIVGKREVRLELFRYAVLKSTQPGAERRVHRSITGPSSASSTSGCSRGLPFLEMPGKLPMRLKVISKGGILTVPAARPAAIRPCCAAIVIADMHERCVKAIIEQKPAGKAVLLRCIAACPFGRLLCGRVREQAKHPLGPLRPRRQIGQEIELALFQNRYTPGQTSRLHYEQ